MITQFHGRYRFLSNFWPAVVMLDEIEFATVEHAYVAAKTLDLKARQHIRWLTKPGEAKRYGRTLPLRSDWNAVRIPVMTNLVRQKFTHPQLRNWLLETGDEQLVEGNSWNDTFWGVCRGVGENHLGKILMQVRAELR